MFVKNVLSIVIALGASKVVAQQGAYAQCGGSGWTGGTTCISGYSCVTSNEYYSQCLPGTAATTTKAAATTKAATTTKAGTTTNAAATTNRVTTAAGSNPTLYLCGDSTMAKNGAGDGFTDGWGSYVSPLVTIPVVNDAIGGRSARSFTREGRFASVLAATKAGDWVVIEFGHNDGGTLSTTDTSGRTDCAGSGEETCQVTYNGVAETVLTYYAYLRNAAKAFKAKGVNVIISSATPNNVWETGTWSYSATRFSTMSKSAAADTGSVFVDHGWFVADRYKTLGATVVDSYYPKDHTHTSPAGAKTVAETFFRGLQCGSAGLNSYLSAAGKAVPAQTCGGI